MLWQVIRALVSSHPVPKWQVLVKCECWARGFGATAKQDQATTAVAKGNSEKIKVWDEARDG